MDRHGTKWRDRANPSGRAFLSVQFTHIVEPLDFADLVDIYLSSLRRRIARNRAHEIPTTYLVADRIVGVRLMPKSQGMTDFMRDHGFKTHAGSRIDHFRNESNIFPTDQISVPKNGRTRGTIRR